MAPENDAVSTFPEALVSHNAQGNLSLSRLLEAHFEYTIKSFFFKTLYVNPSFGKKGEPILLILMEFMFIFVKPQVGIVF